MTLANEGLEGLETPYGLKFLIGLAFAGSGLYAWGRRPENRLGPLMTAVGCIYLLAQILIQAHASTLFTAGIWISDAWVVLFVVFLLAFPDGRINARFDLVVIGMFALMAFPLELAWLLFWTTGGSPENALAVWPNATVAGNVDSAQRSVVVLASVVLAITLARRWLLASPPLRRALVPILVGSVSILLGSVLVALDKFQIEFPTASGRSSWPTSPSRWSSWAASSAPGSPARPLAISSSSSARIRHRPSSATRSPGPCATRRSASRTGSRSSEAGPTSTAGRWSCPRRAATGRRR